MDQGFFQTYEAIGKTMWHLRLRTGMFAFSWAEEKREKKAFLTIFWQIIFPHFTDQNSPWEWVRCPYFSLHPPRWQVEESFLSRVFAYPLGLSSPTFPPPQYLWISDKYLLILLIPFVGMHVVIQYICLNCFNQSNTFLFGSISRRFLSGYFFFPSSAFLLPINFY